MLKYKKLYLKIDAQCGTEIKTVDRKTYMLAIVEDRERNWYYSFVGDDRNSYVSLYSGGYTGGGVTYPLSLKERGYTFIRFFNFDLDSQDSKEQIEEKKIDLDLLACKLATDCSWRVSI